MQIISMLFLSEKHNTDNFNKLESYYLTNLSKLKIIRRN